MPESNRARPSSPAIDDEALIITAELAEDEQVRLNAMRERFFPAQLNLLDAHLTLFHAIPGERRRALCALLEQARHHLPLDVTLAGLMRLGKGFAVTVNSPALMQLHALWQRELSAWLTAQDRQKRKLHITVQNKVTPAQARHDFAVAQLGFAARSTHVVAFAIWRYEQGPWALLERFPAPPR